MQEILTLYKNEFGFSQFYDRLLHNIKTWERYHIKSPTFLSGYSPKEIDYVRDSDIHPMTQNGDIRVDLPVWFGDFSAKKRIVFLGLEPRDSDKSGYLNIERYKNFVFATPFALERPKGPYHSAFSRIIHDEHDYLFYFTDIVKTYNVTTSKHQDDRIARGTFWGRAVERMKFLMNELDIITPTVVVALGNESYHFLTKMLGDKYRIEKIRHPANGGANVAREQIDKIMETM